MKISRRKFAQLLGAGAAGALVRPQISFARAATAAGVIRLSSNENPYGPSAKALRAMSDAFDLAWRYPDEQNDALIEALAKMNGVAPENILLGDGSGEILKLCAETFTGPRGSLVVADPTFEAIAQHAKNSGAEISKIPITKNFAHDLAKMSAAPRPGLIYICNPNNPTASITPKKELRDFISAAAPETAILVDEAYFHYADDGAYESVIPLVQEHANLIVARTFSKIYGMAGLRCGYAVAQKETIARLRVRQPWDSVNCIALAAALASVRDPEQVETNRARNREVKNFVVGELHSLGHETIPSQANFIMFDLKRPAAPVIAALRERKIHVGRLFPTLPNHLRLTIGKRAEIESFLTAFREVAT